MADERWTNPPAEEDEEDDGPPCAIPIDVQPVKLPDPLFDGGAGPSSPTPAATPSKPVPVTIITGYLGAGKTTLINRILTTKHGYRCAVLMNEFGESADVEKALIKEPEGTDANPLANWVQLENGCICCSVKNDMVKALEALLQQRDAFDCILIETTGLANPGPVAAALWTDGELEAGVCLDAVVAVVDSRNVGRQLAEPPPEPEGVTAAAQQIAFADVVLLNKVDLVGEEDLAAITEQLAGINSAAAVLPCTRCEVELARILDTGLYAEQGRRADAVLSSLDDTADGVAHDHVHTADGVAHDHVHTADGVAHDHGDPAPASGHGHDHDHDHHPPPAHTSGIRAVTAATTAPVRLPALRAWMDDLLWERGPGRPDLYRVKALVNVAGAAERHVLQAVQDLYDVVPAAPWRADERRATKMVFIGRGVDAEELQRGLEACCQ